MHNSSVDNANKGWDTFFYSVAIGVLGVTVIACGPAVLSSCDRKIRQVFSRASAFFSESARTRVPEPLDSAGVRLLVGPKNLGKLPDGREMVIRPTFPDGNCFFTCAAVGLLEYLQENKEHLEFIVDVIQKDFCLSEDGKQSVIGTLTQLTYLENPEDLEAYFKNNSLMYEMVVLLRHLMGSALEEEPTFETPEDTPKILSKHDFYAEILGAVAHVPEVRKLYPIEPEYTPEAFEKVVALIRQPYIWPSAACIRALCLKLGIDFNILKEIGGGRIHYDPKAKNLPRAGNLLLQGNHYSKVYPLPAFKIVQGTLTTGDSRKVEVIEIQTKQDKPLFLGVAVSLLESLYKKKIFLEELNITSEADPKCIDVMTRASVVETNSDLQRIFEEERSMQQVENYLRGLVGGTLEEDINSQARALVESLGLPLSIGKEVVGESGGLKVRMIASIANDVGLLLFQGEGVASFFPKP